MAVESAAESAVLVAPDTAVSLALIERELDTASSGRFDGLLGISIEMITSEAATEDGSAE